MLNFLWPFDDLILFIAALFEDTIQGVHKLHLINWDTISRPKDCGGLGIRPMRLLNDTTLANLLWKYIHEIDKLGVQLLCYKYGKGDVRL